eukprot:SAG11_NODE_325_length_10712_cov_15.479883_7_plen_92_part_00
MGDKKEAEPKEAAPREKYNWSWAHKVVLVACYAALFAGEASECSLDVALPNAQVSSQLPPEKMGSCGPWGRKVLAPFTDRCSNFRPIPPRS